MNERILELYRQSQSSGYFGKSFDPEKFAELIVRECIANCDDLNSMKYIADHFDIKIQGLEG